jgi:hypothetical protein
MFQSVAPVRAAPAWSCNTTHLTPEWQEMMMVFYYKAKKYSDKFMFLSPLQGT